MEYEQVATYMRDMHSGSHRIHACLAEAFAFRITIKDDGAVSPFDKALNEHIRPGSPNLHLISYVVLPSWLLKSM